MSSDRKSISSLHSQEDSFPAEPSLTIVPLGTTFLHAPLISHELLEIVRSQIARSQKTLLLYNRRGSGRAWICQDCSYFPLCPHCDIALAYHSHPSLRLMCHQCGYVDIVPESCPLCHGQHFRAVGIGTQRLDADISKLIPHTSTLRIDTDAQIRKSTLVSQIDKADIIIGTYGSAPLLHHDSITQICILLFESDLTFPDYRIEEDLYHTLNYIKNSKKPLLIQTYLPDHALLYLLGSGNYKDFLRDMSKERKKFHYPPYSDFVVIHIHDTRKEKVSDIATKMINKITLIKEDTLFVSYDANIFFRNRGEWEQKILLKGKSLQGILSCLEVEIVRNRSVTLEWK